MSARRRPSGRAVAAATIALLVAALVASCSAIPSSGPVRSNAVNATAAPEQFIRVLARPPRSGATPTEIVGGFLAASASFDNDHAVARTYLTADASSTWRPSAHVSVYDSEPGYGLADFGPNNVRMLAFKRAGEISARGQFAQPTGSSQFRANFAMKKVGGQWRIGGVPQGMILSNADVARAYRAVNMYFLDVAGGTLVPDPIFLPFQQPGIATTLTRELLLGPTKWLAPAVRTGFPSGTKLAVDAVPVQEGIARVDLEPRAVVATGEQRRALAAQLTYTLTQIADVRGVRITLSGVPFAIPGVGPVTQLSDWSSFDPNDGPLDQATYAIDSGHLAVVTTGTAPVPGYFGTTRAMTAAATSLDGRWIAASLKEGSSSVVRFGATATANAAKVYTGRDVTTLSFDRLGSAWFADTGTDARGRQAPTMWTARSDRAAAPVRLQGLPGSTIRALKVSRDGARIAVVTASSPRAAGEVLLGRVQRDGGFVTATGFRRVEHALTGARDVAWADDTTLLVVGRRGSESLQAFGVGIDGASLVSNGGVPSMATIAACPDRPYLTGTTVNTLWIDRGNGWRVFVTGTRPIYPG